ncbi:MAG: hypothetical protein PWQ48_1411 [Thermotogaceae bacterium]|jgi:hypothetical protein|nr:hypothetical protein [Thermotogaceae bacterium]
MVHRLKFGRSLPYYVTKLVFVSNVMSYHICIRNANSSLSYIEDGVFFAVS